VGYDPDQDPPLGSMDGGSVLGVGAFYSDVQGSAAGGPRDYTSLRLNLMELFERDVPVLIDELESIEYHTNMVDALGVDWQLKIYTLPLPGQVSGWYGHRFNFVRPDNPDGNWDKWSTDTFNVEWIRSGTGTSSYPDALFSTVSAPHAAEQIFFVDIIAGYATDSPPCHSYLDAVTVKLKDGSMVTLDLEMTKMSVIQTEGTAGVLSGTSGTFMAFVGDTGGSQCTNWWFEYSEIGSGNWLRTPISGCAEPNSYVFTNVTGLEPGSVYWMRAFASNESGIFASSAYPVYVLP
jgi:hypothetical protein